MVYSKTLVLCGGHKGLNGELGGVTWKGGKAEIIGPPRSVEGLCKYLGRCYQAFPEGSDELRAKQEQLGELQDQESPKQGDPDEVLLAADDAAIADAQGADDGVGAEEAETPGSGEGDLDRRRREMREAVEMLDGANSEYWTMDGQPRLKPLEDLLGRPLTRKEVNELLQDSE